MTIALSTSSHVETPRDRDETAFTPILREIWRAHAQVRAVTFVDITGECVDYCASLDPYEAQVLGAHLSVLMSQLRTSALRMGLVGPRFLRITAEKFELMVLRVSAAYALCIAIDAGSSVHRIVSAALAAIPKICQEMGSAHFLTKGVLAAAEVELEGDLASNYRPKRFREQGVAYDVSEVLGVWSESPPQYPAPIRGFRVRTDRGLEVNLVHDLEHNRWYCEL